LLLRLDLCLLGLELPLLLLDDAQQMLEVVYLIGEDGHAGLRAEPKKTAANKVRRSHAWKPCQANFGSASAL
jgi:hypothetical protein